MLLRLATQTKVYATSRLKANYQTPLLQFIRMILVIDNYDSFTYNLVQYLGELGAELAVFRNDAITVDQMEKHQPERILISPGPGVPRDAGVTIDAIRAFAGKIPILGVCLGNQAIGEAFGGRVVRAPYLMHGKTSEICT